MARLYSDLLSGSSRYYYGLTSAPGGVQPAQATITFGGLAPTIFEQTTVFRTPAPAVLTFSGPLTTSDIVISPATGAITLSGQIPDVPRSTTVTNQLPPDYTNLADLAPTVLFINTLIPVTGGFTFTYPQVNVTEGGNIGFISPSVGSFTIQGQAPTVIFINISVGAFTFEGRAPTLQTSLTIEPENPGSMSFDGNAPTIERPFQWIDTDPPPAVTWTTTTGIAA